jgi:hypothetical protein
MGRRISFFTNTIVGAVVVGATLSAVSSAQAEWTIDFSRRMDQLRKSEFVEPGPAAGRGSYGRGPASVTEDSAPTVLPEKALPEKTVLEKTSGFIDTLFSPAGPTEDVVVLNTETGFVPSTLRFKTGVNYRLTVVNINEKARNVSFIVDAFSEHHSTYYGQQKVFVLQPKEEGVFTFISPETSAKGRIVVQGHDPRAAERAPSSEGK